MRCKFSTMKNQVTKSRFWLFVLFFPLLAVVFCTNCSTTQKETEPAFRLDLKAPIDNWDEAIPLGNGLTGGLLWGEGNEIRLSLDRGDLWDLRPHPGFTAPGFSYETICQMAQAGRADSLNKKFAKASDVPTKLPGCRLVISLPDNETSKSFHLDMLKGLGTADFGDGKIECFFSAVQPVALVKIPGELKEFHLVANPAVTKLGNQPARIEKNENATWLVQDASLGFKYAFYVQSRKYKNYTLLAISSATNRESDDPLKFASKQTTEALDVGYSRNFNAHLKWWDEFWSCSSVSIPDSLIQQHYNLVQYFYGAASRKGVPPMPLQGVWTADAGTLPPWHGDYHHDLNTQLTYWAYLTSNRFEEGESFLDFMWSLKPVHEKFARNFYGVSGLVVPGVMALDGRPMGVWYQYSVSPTMGAWIAQSFYWHWRYTMDTQFLKEKAYPYCSEVADALVGLMKPDKNGKLKLPLSSSPEIHNNSQQAWLTPNSNFDLSLIRWIFKANTEMAETLGLKKEAAHWQDLLSKMDNLAVEGEDGPLKISPDEILKESHRHFSHLMAIYPLGTLNTEGTDHERNIINASLKQIDSLGTKLWCGYSFSWMACMRARVGQGDKALENLKDYMDCTLRNGFHVNGPQTRKELSDFKMRAFTLEGNFAASQAVHEMLLQSWGGRIRIFPAVPEEWADASFHHLRTEGGFIVDAERRNNKTVKVTIIATSDQKLRLKNPFGFEEFDSTMELYKNGTDELDCMMKKGQQLVLKLKEI